MKKATFPPEKKILLKRDCLKFFWGKKIISALGGKKERLILFSGGKGNGTFCLLTAKSDSKGSRERRRDSNGHSRKGKKSPNHAKVTGGGGKKRAVPFSPRVLHHLQGSRRRGGTRTRGGGPMPST